MTYLFVCAKLGKQQIDLKGKTPEAVTVPGPPEEQSVARHNWVPLYEGDGEVISTKHRHVRCNRRGGGYVYICTCGDVQKGCL